ncbi:MAG: (d)CMP kinase [Candidatus Dormibacteraeota bacterium]|nr:(d)CMP kinase [Candidatus Dormibacteraeota bacterium]
MSRQRIVTVDGPAGSGKSTLGRALAIELGLPLIDTGLFYRGIMVAAVRARVDVGDPSALADLARQTTVALDTDPRSGGDHVVVDGIVDEVLLRDPSYAALLAAISSTPAVRAAVLEPQRALAAGGAVAVGRDCGTVVFPDAAVKFYLAAPQSVREERRLAQLRARGADADDTALRAEVADRDRADTDRAASPLTPALDALVVDTAAMDVPTMIAYALQLCHEAGLDPVPTR